MRRKIITIVTLMLMIVGAISMNALATTEYVYYSVSGWASTGSVQNGGSNSVLQAKAFPSTQYGVTLFVYRDVNRTDLLAQGDYPYYSNNPNYLTFDFRSGATRYFACQPLVSGNSTSGSIQSIY